MTKRQTIFAVICLILTPIETRSAHTQDKLPLQRVQTIPMSGVSGRLDHLGVDVEGGRLFAAALGDSQNTVEVIDLKAGKRISSIRGQSMPQGVFYSADFKKLFVANGKDGTVKIFRGDNLGLVGSLPVGTGADHVGYDQATKDLYVGVSIPNSRVGELAIVDTRTNKKIGAIQTDSRPGGIKIETASPRIFVTLGGLPRVGVVDREKQKQIATWPLTGVPSVVALALDETNHRLFGASRNPPMLTVLDTESGKQITQLDGVEGIDDLWYDAEHHRIYASGGRGAAAGFVYVYQQRDADHYELTAKIPTRADAQTSIWVPQLNRLYVSASANGNENAAILVFEPQP
ncbi:MAG: YncE family protein [Xanthobacteraceae bacterium]|nr:YncE family protein [Xanthobacteraceae bacterium]